MHEFSFHRLPDRLFDLHNRRCAVNNDNASRFVACDPAVSIAYPLVEFPSRTFHPVKCKSCTRLSLSDFRYRNIHEQRQVRFYAQRGNSVDGSDRIEIETPAISLVCRRGVGKAITEDDFSTPQGRRNDFAHQLRSAGREKEHLGPLRHLRVILIQENIPNALGYRRSPRFPDKVHGRLPHIPACAGLLQSFEEQLRLCRLAAEIESFECDKHENNITIFVPRINTRRNGCRKRKQQRAGKVLDTYACFLYLFASSMRNQPRPHKAPPLPPFDPAEQRKLDSRAEDSRLIRAALTGDDGAYKKLMKKYHDAIYGFIFRMIREKEQVEDLTQEAFIKAFGSLANFNEEYAFSTWLYKIATNNCIDYIRKRRLQLYSIDRPIQSKESEYSFELPDYSSEADRELISDQRTRLLNEAIDHLPEKYRTVILLRHTEEKSYEEIAKMLKLPIGTVKAHIFRAREILYKALRDKIRHY
jgi:RNA polymerase sigma factor (sigma-70 family)